MNQPTDQTATDNLDKSGAETPRGRIRILIVDDHPAFRYGLRHLIGKLDDAEVCGEADDAPSALKAFRELEPDLVLMDISLPSMNGIELTKMMRSERRDLPVLILSMHDESFYGIRALRAGARGYMRKDYAIKDLAEAVRCTARNDYYLSRRFQNQLIYKAIHLHHDGSGGEEDGTLLQNLSDREMEVFQWLGQGFGTRQIAEKLGLSIKTVETHRAHIKSKLSLSSAEDMVQLAKEWVSLEMAPAAAHEESVANAADEIAITEDVDKTPV